MNQILDGSPVHGSHLSDAEREIAVGCRHRFEKTSGTRGFLVLPNGLRIPVNLADEVVKK